VKANKIRLRMPKMRFSKSTIAAIAGTMIAAVATAGAVLPPDGDTPLWTPRWAVGDVLGQAAGGTMQWRVLSIDFLRKGYMCAIQGAADIFVLGSVLDSPGIIKTGSWL